MPDHQIPKKLPSGGLQERKRFRDAPTNYFKDSLKASIKIFQIDPAFWKVATQDRCGWGDAVHKGAKRCEARRTDYAAEQRLTNNGRPEKKKRFRDGLEA